VYFRKKGFTEGFCFYVKLLVQLTLIIRVIKFLSFRDFHI